MIQLEERLYTSTEVADILGVSLRSVYRYLEENKIDAEVKTATGRHRFSKTNILDFLYPNGAKMAEVKTQTAEVTDETPKKKTSVKKAAKAEEEAPAVVQEVEESEPKEEPIDWLAKFREAARKYREEEKATEVVTEEVVEEAVEEVKPAPKKAPIVEPEVVSEPERSFVENISGLGQEEEQPIRKNFYRSSLGGLKDIAQNIDRGSRNSYLDYAFTLNAGLSLYKPIKPFSVLHAYVKPGDVMFFEKLLGLSPSDEVNAQLCLILSDDSKVYKGKEELHGLFVVSKEQLLDDVKSMGDSSLVAESGSVLK